MDKNGENVNKDKKQDRNKKLHEALNTLRNGIIGLAELLVVISIIYSTVVIWIGTDDTIPKLMVIPAVGQALFYIIKNFIVRRSK